MRPCCLPHLINQKLFPKIFSNNSSLEDLHIPLPAFPSGTNLKLHNISVTLKMFQKVIMNLNSSKVSGPDCNPVVVLKNCQPELSCMYSMLEESLQIVWSSLMIHVFKKVVERSTALLARSTCPVSLLFVVSKVFEKLVNNNRVETISQR